MTSPATFAGVLREMAQDSNDALDTFLAYLKAHNLTAMLPAILRHLEREDARESDRKHVVIETPFDLSETARGDIRTKIGAPEEAQERVIRNDDLIGGFIAEYNYMRYDASMRRALQKLHHHLLH